MSNARIDERVGDAIQAAIRRALLQAWGERVINEVQTRVDQRGVPSTLSEPIARAILREELSKLREFVTSSEDTELDELAGRFVALVVATAAKGISFDQFLEAYAKQGDLLGEDAGIKQLFDRIQTRAEQRLQRLFGSDAMDSAVVELTQAVLKLQEELRQAEEGRRAFWAFEDIGGAPELLRAARFVPVTVFVEGGVVAEAQVLRPLKRLLDLAGYDEA